MVGDQVSGTQGLKVRKVKLTNLIRNYLDQI